jgi:hypothetical protein
MRPEEKTGALLYNTNKNKRLAIFSNSLLCLLLFTINAGRETYNKYIYIHN